MNISVSLKSNHRPQCVRLVVFLIFRRQTFAHSSRLGTHFTIEQHIKDFMVEELEAHVTIFCEYMYVYIALYFCLGFSCLIFLVSHFYVFFSCCLSSTSLKDLFFHSSSLFRILLISRASKKMKKIYLTNREEEDGRRARSYKFLGKKVKNKIS